MTQFDKRNISMMTDLYELTMANGYFLNGNENDRVAFDVFYRRNPDGGGFAIFAGLEQVVELIEGLHFDDEDIDYLRSLGLFDERFLAFLKDFRFTGDVYAFREGSIIYPNEPILTIVAPLAQSQLIETALLTIINHQSLIATKANRIVRAAQGRAISDMGARRAHNLDAAVYGARAAYIGGVANTATVLAGKQFGIPVVGTMAHSWVMFYENEYDAFCRYADIYGSKSVFLVDTYNTLESGVPTAIRVAHEVLHPRGERLLGIRIDSGDMAYLSKKARRMLDDAGMQDCRILGSNSLDEFTISSMLTQGGCIDSFGVGERLITSYSDAMFGAVYKLVAVERDGHFVPKIKLSENIGKITNPGLKSVYRIYSEEGQAVADLLTCRDETPDLSVPYTYISPDKPWQQRQFRHCTAKPLQQLVISNGQRTMTAPSLNEIRSYVRHQLDTEIWKEEQRFNNPHAHYLDMSPAYYQLKMNLMQACKI
ncbi:nicotinate phosphoribosyltransferase [Hoylesella marshii]|uniref:Nicotinate phosphoribosyltransferase n=1 Tax=Hoylesella marshii DSM 16973 = JCM 13450 TaxID=862515 RepID=E0NRD9_9BACT|nr:nicotinate phosphoribosyltransferase [Hoylesella marshii]EFM02235.1 nicotinate phosphoribosyltransferase [Hoylesella marshii DSM 16973 = JCM 13450]